MNHEPLRVGYLGGEVTSDARVIAVVIGRQALDHQYAVELVDAGDGDALRGAHRPAVLQPEDRQGQVAPGHRARQGRALAQVQVVICREGANFGRNWNVRKKKKHTVRLTRQLGAAPTEICDACRVPASGASWTGLVVRRAGRETTSMECIVMYKRGWAPRQGLLTDDGDVAAPPGAVALLVLGPAGVDAAVDELLDARDDEGAVGHDLLAQVVRELAAGPLPADLLDRVAGHRALEPQRLPGHGRHLRDQPDVRETCAHTHRLPALTPAAPRSRASLRLNGPRGRGQFFARAAWRGRGDVLGKRVGAGRF